MADRADLVIVGAGTVGGWASVFARADGVGRVVVLERGQVGSGASSRAAGIVRAQGGTPQTVLSVAGRSTSTTASWRPTARIPGSASSATSSSR